MAGDVRALETLQMLGRERIEDTGSVGVCWGVLGVLKCWQCCKIYNTFV